MRERRPVADGLSDDDRTEIEIVGAFDCRPHAALVLQPVKIKVSTPRPIR